MYFFHIVFDENVYHVIVELIFVANRIEDSYEVIMCIVMPSLIFSNLFRKHLQYV